MMNECHAGSLLGRVQLSIFIKSLQAGGTSTQQLAEAAQKSCACFTYLI